MSIRRDHDPRSVKSFSMRSLHSVLSLSEPEISVHVGAAAAPRPVNSRIEDTAEYQVSFLKANELTFLNGRMTISI